MTRRRLAGALALASIGVLIGGAFLGLAVEGARDWTGAASAVDSHVLRILRFTLWQAALSTLLSVAPAILVARALSRRPAFPGRALVLRLFALPLALPAIVAALGLLELFGRAGILARGSAALGIGQWPGIYGLPGILIAHVFFNLPLATRLLLEALNAVGPNQWRLASQLGMGAWSAFRFIEWPALRAGLPAAAGLAFMLCVTSFTLVLTLGGGPGATTLEVAIYQALRFDFDPARALVLTLTQLALTGGVLFALALMGATAAGGADLDVAAGRPPVSGVLANGTDFCVIGAAVLFVANPILAIVATGIKADLARLALDPAVRSAALSSLCFATLSAVIAVALSLALAAWRSQTGHGAASTASFAHRFFEAVPGYVLVVPPVVIGAGWFVLLRNATDVLALAPIMVVTVNAVMAAPFALRVIRPAYDAAATRDDRLCSLLGISGWSRLRLIDWPVLRRPVLVAGAFAMALSLGDLGVVALFGSDSVQTLPYLLLSRMGSYRTEDAAGLALMLGALCLALMTLADRIAAEPVR